MINEYLNKQYINNESDIKKLFNNKKYIDIFNSINDENIIFKSNLIHKNKTISLKEQFIFNIDNYITFIKQFIFINPLELRYIISLTLNKNVKKLLISKYYYDNIDYYNDLYKKIFMSNYLENVSKLSKYINIKTRNFDELVKLINNKKRVYSYFEPINNKNINFICEIIKSIEDIT